MTGAATEKGLHTYSGLVDASKILAATFGATLDETIESTTARRRRDYRDGVFIGGTVVVQALINGSDGTRKSEVTIDHENCPFSAEQIARYSLEATCRLRQNPDDYVHRSLPAQI